MAHSHETTINSSWAKDIRGDGYSVVDIGQGVITEVQPPLDEDELSLATGIGIYGGINGRRVVQREATDTAPATTVIRHEMYYSERPSETRSRAEHDALELAFILKETRNSNVTVLREGEVAIAMTLGGLAV